MLITTRANLRLLNDIDMLLFFEKGVRGGINGIGELRHFQANNKHMESFDDTKPSVYGRILRCYLFLCWCNAANIAPWTIMNGLKM